MKLSLEQLSARMRQGETIPSRQTAQVALALSIPSILEQLVVTAMGYIDAAMVGHIGAEATASIGIVSSSTWLLHGVLVGLYTALSIQIAQYLGADRQDDARSVLRQAMLFNVILGVGAALFGLGISLIAGAFSLVMMSLPTVIRTTQESLKTVPQSYREGSLALGSGKWHMIRTVVLPSSVDGIVTGCILAVGRIVGESAVLMFTAGMGMRLAKYGDTLGEFFTNLFDSSGATLTVALYNYAKERADFDSAFAVAVVLLVIAFVINIAAKLAGKKLKNR